MVDSAAANSLTAAHSVATGSTGPEPTRRDFLFIATGAATAVAAGAAVWPLISQMSPDASTLALASISVSHVVAQQARDFQRITVGPDPTWVDSLADGPAVYVYGGELDWSGGAPPWQNVFWNRRIGRVYTLGGRRILGPLPSTAVTRPPRPNA